MPKNTTQAALALLALIALSADAADSWPNGLKPANAMYLCSSGTNASLENSFVVWVDKKQQVLAISPPREDWHLPTNVNHLVLDKYANALHADKKAKRGIFLTVGSSRSSRQLRISRTVADCSPTYEE